MKKCSKCKEPKALDQFDKHRRHRDGLQSGCRQCQSVPNRAWKVANPERVAANNRAWRIANPEKVAVSNRAWNVANPERRAAYSREWKRERYANDPNFRLATSLRTRLRRALKHKSKRGSAVALLGCSVSEAVAHIESQFTEGMTWRNWSPRGWHVDHIRPLCSFDLEDPDQLAEACHYTNLQPLWAQDNATKSGKRVWRKV